ncbi:MAG: hypothetical protein AAFY76_22585, partial [Cyanobacteria bacterium J06649_11]
MQIERYFQTVQSNFQQQEYHFQLFDFGERGALAGRINQFEWKEQQPPLSWLDHRGELFFVVGQASSLDFEQYKAVSRDTLKACQKMVYPGDHGNTFYNFRIPTDLVFVTFAVQ